MSDPDAVKVRVRLQDRGTPQLLPTPTPAISWRVVTGRPGWRSAGATITLRRNGSRESYEVPADTSQYVPWPFAPLAPYSSADIRVTVRGQDGSVSQPSPWLTARTGPLSSHVAGGQSAGGQSAGGQDAGGQSAGGQESASQARSTNEWHGRFIAAPGSPWLDPTIAPGPVPPAPRPTVRFRRAILVRDGLVEAVWSLSAHGVVHPVIDGHPVWFDEFTPGWSAYQDRLVVRSYDVTDQLSADAGHHVLGATVAEGWYGERYGFGGKVRPAYAGPLALWAQLRLRYSDGTIEWVATDESWQAATGGPVVSASLYQGEHYDARLEDRALFEATADFPGAAPAEVLPDGVGNLAALTPAETPPAIVVRTLRPAHIHTRESGAVVVDFGQNISGWVALRLEAPQGTTVTVRHAEVLDADIKAGGQLVTRTLRHAEATDSYTARGAGVEQWHPHFTSHGFRFVEITGWPGTPHKRDLEAQVVRTDMEPTGTLVTGNDMLDAFHAAVERSWQGNTLTLPTDCPQRDERLGWTGDIQVFAPAAGYLEDTTAFLRAWLRDLAAEQHHCGGVVPFTVPDALRGEPVPAAGWGDAATLVPWQVWMHSGDLAVLRDQYPSMRAWVEAVRAAAGEDLVWRGGFQLGDWLDPTAPPDDPSAAATAPELVATAYFARSVAVVADVAALLGLEPDAATYAALAQQVRAAFVEAFVAPSGLLTCDTQTAYALAIVFDLLPGPGAVAAAGGRLAQLARAGSYRIGTGFVGTPLVCEALTRAGHVETAYRLLLEQGCPSWLYPLTMGATTVWERWDSLLPDGSVNPGEMTSFNHYALGAVADWMHSTIGGIAPETAGYSTVRIAPRPGGGLRDVSARLDTGYGLIKVRWHLSDGVLAVDAVIPPGMRGVLDLPGAAIEHVDSGTHHRSVHHPEPV